MKKTKKASEASHEKQHENFVRQRNERCFLKDKQKIQYHSFILLEIVPLEKINQLISGIDKLYANVSISQESRLNYKNILSDCHSKLFQWNTLNLPYITTSKLKGEVLPNCAFHDLGDKIRHMHISIYKVLPSSVILQIQVYLDDKISKKINDTIYKSHKEIREPIETPKGKYTNIYGPERQKKLEIYQLRKELHKEAIDFLNNYFKGYFFELSKENISVVPSIDLFSLDYPEKEDEISDWGIENSGFFHCFNTCIMPWDSFKYENYLFCFESERDIEFENYVIFANRKTSTDDMYSDIDSAIEEGLNFCSFDLIAIDRWVRTQESVVGKLNSTVSEDISKIQENKFSKAIETRKVVLKSVFSFERFGAEYKGYGFIPDKFAFKSLKDKKNPERQIDLFKGLKEGIGTRIKEINNLIDGFTRQYETILNLKSLEFSKNMQTKVVTLTIVVIVLAILQIIILIDSKIPESIIKLLFGGC
jgi:hypothetical protein